MRLAIAFNPNLSPDQAKVFITDYILDLAEFAVTDVEEAIRAYRRDEKQFTFPKPGLLYKLASLARRDRTQRATAKPIKPQFGDQRPIMWWTQSLWLWKPHWRETEIPNEHFAAYQAVLAKKRAAGIFGWADDDFAGLHRKYAEIGDRPYDPRKGTR